MKRLFFLLSLSLVIFVAQTALQAKIIAEDLIEYPADTELHRWAGNSPNPIPFPTLDGGLGWKTPWTQWYGFRENDAYVYLNEGEVGDLTGAFPLGYRPRGDTRIQIYHASLGRELSTTAGGKGTTYIGFAKKHASAANGSDDPVGVGFQLLTGGIQGKPVFSFFREGKDIWGIDDKGDTSIDNTGWAEDEKAYHYLFKIVDDGTTAKVFANRYTNADTVTEEPTTWQVDGIEIPSFTFDTVYFKGNKVGPHAKTAPIWFDEVRLATEFKDMGFSQANVELKAKEAADREAARVVLEGQIKERMKTAWQQGTAPMPEASNIANVVAYGAARDGVTDDTDAINRAFEDATMVYFPPGTYLVSGTLQMGIKASSNKASQNRLIGAGRDVTTIKLKEGTFKDKEKPRAVVAFHKDYPVLKGTTGMAFSNYITDVTIEIGPNNPGATAVAYITNNDGAIRNVTIKSTDPQGAGFCGIDMRKGWCGPGIIKNVEIVGFDTAIDYSFREYSMTIENLKLSGQRVVGIHNRENILSIHNLTSENTVPAIINGSPRAITVLLEGNLRGGNGGAAIKNSGGFLFLRNVEASGYTSVVEGVEGLNVAEYSSIPVDAKALDLPIKDHAIEPLPLDQWVSVGDHGATPEDTTDDSAAIQAAIDAAAAAGKKKVYFPYGGTSAFKGNHYRIEAPVRVHGSVQEIDFLFAPIEVGESGGFLIEEGPAPVVVFQRTGVVFGGSGTLIHHKANRAVQLRDFPHQTTVPYHNEGSTGDVFLENIAPVNAGAIGPFVKGQNVWGRSINPEFAGIHLHNAGAKVWILGFKTEQNGINALTENGGTTAIFGGLIYPNRKHFKELQGDFPSFKSIDSIQSLVGLGSQGNGGTNLNPVEEQRDGKTTSIPAADFQTEAYSGNEWLIPVYVSPPLR